MSEITLTPVDPAPDEVRYLEDRIYEFNSSATDITDGELLAIVVRQRDRIVAGISRRADASVQWHTRSEPRILHDILSVAGPAKHAVCSREQ